MALSTYDRGSSILVEVEVKKHAPFSTDSYIDPSSAKISVIDPLGTVKVNEASLAKFAEGKYYYTCQTGTDWIVGIYTIKVVTSDGALTDVTIPTEGFKLR